MKALVLGRGQDFVSRAQLSTFFYNRKLLKQKLGLEFEHFDTATFAEMEAACQDSRAEVFFLMPFWNENAAEAEKILSRMRVRHATQKIILMDPFAQATSNYFNLLPYVDSFLKRQMYRDLEEYQKPYEGGTAFTDFLVKQWGFDLEGWSVNSTIPAGYEHRITTGWNLGTAKEFRDMLCPRFSLPFAQKPKDIDLFCRLSLGKPDQRQWYYEYRLRAVQALQPWSQAYRVASSGGLEAQSLVPYQQYNNELQRSRMVFSPFGWGEGCWRDFEAVCNNSLLMKPSMEHLVTEPSFFIAGETYVPVRWDLSDLEEKCCYYLSHPEEMARIVANARRVYQDYFKHHQFIKKIGALVGESLRTVA